MARVVDTSVILDLVTGDPLFEPASISCLQRHLSDGLQVCPVTFVEIGPAFRGDPAAAEAFLHAAGIGCREIWTHDDTRLAHKLWNDHQARRRQQLAAKRPVADILIAAFGSRYQGIITRNAADFRVMVPGLTLVEP